MSQLEIIDDRIQDYSKNSFDLTDSIISGILSESSNVNNKITKNNSNTWSSTYVSDATSKSSDTKSTGETKSTKSSGTTFNRSSKSSDKSCISDNCVTVNILPSKAEPFIYDRKNNVIRFNFERLVSSKAEVVFGGNNGNFSFDSSNLGLSVGKNNLLECYNSTIFGSNNKIRSRECNTKIPNTYENNSIISGSNNELTNASNTSLIGCSGVKLKNSRECVALGIKGTSEDQFPENLNETLLVRNIYVAGNLTARNIEKNSVYVEGNEQRDVYYSVSEGDGIDIIYVNSIKGQVYIQLGSPGNIAFEKNRVIVIKDVSLEFPDIAKNNSHVILQKDNIDLIRPRMEYYENGLLTVGDDPLKGYIIDTDGGSVTYRYMEALLPGSRPTWVIENQFLGNLRITPFPPTGVEPRIKLLQNKHF